MRRTMKIATLFILLLLATLASGAPNPDEYSINVHVSSSYFLAGGFVQGLKVLIDGKKYELRSGGASTSALLALGDYKAKLVKDDHKTTYESSQEYEFLFPDKKTKRFYVAGQTE
jgi:hypothetical protein